MVVMAQQAPRTLSFVDAEISAICGDDPSPYIERIRLLHRISSNLALEQLECCRACRRPRPCAAIARLRAEADAPREFFRSLAPKSANSGYCSASAPDNIHRQKE